VPITPKTLGKAMATFASGAPAGPHHPRPGRPRARRCDGPRLERRQKRPQVVVFWLMPGLPSVVL